MLQIIIFQLSALIWATTADPKSSGIQMLGICIAAVFAFLGIVQGSSIPSMTP